MIASPGDGLEDVLAVHPVHGQEGVEPVPGHTVGQLQVSRARELWQVASLYVRGKRGLAWGSSVARLRPADISAILQEFSKPNLA